jgi:hypothetical protein
MKSLYVGSVPGTGFGDWMRTRYRVWRLDASKNNEMEEVTQMNTIDISGFYQVVLPYSKVILVLVVAFFVISLTKKLIRRFLSTTGLPPDVQNLLRRIVVYALWFSVLMYAWACCRPGSQGGFK